ncbi:MAG: ATP-dependent Clp protease proteolytic subunit [Terracidiphilus sp.]|jgi:ATP-dependent protease ClpP protease subunit
MKSVERILALTILALISTLPTLAQTPGNAPPERVVINFMLPIAPETMNALVNVVNAQVARGVKKITIVVSSHGGDTASGFAAYNMLTKLPPDVELTTFNTGIIDSAAMLLFCAGKHRYSFPDPARFLIHGNSLDIMGNASYDANGLGAQLAQLNNLNQMSLNVIAAIVHPDKKKDIEAAMHGQIILSPKDAESWGLIDAVRTNFMEEGAVFVSVNAPASSEPLKTDTQPVITSTSITK